LVGQVLEYRGGDKNPEGQQGREGERKLRNFEKGVAISALGEKSGEKDECWKGLKRTLEWQWGFFDKKKKITRGSVYERVYAAKGGKGRLTGKAGKKNHQNGGDWGEKGWGGVLRKWPLRGSTGIGVGWGKDRTGEGNTGLEGFCKKGKRRGEGKPRSSVSSKVGKKRGGEQQRTWKPK